MFYLLDTVFGAKQLSLQWVGVILCIDAAIFPEKLPPERPQMLAQRGKREFHGIKESGCDFTSSIFFIYGRY